MTNDRKNRAARAEQMRKEREKAERRQRNIISVVIVAVVLALVGVGAWAVVDAQGDNEKQADVVTPENTDDDFGVRYVGEGEPNDDAPVVQVFEDFLCPGCGQFEATNGDQLREMADAGDIQLIYQPYSFLDAMGGSTNEYSLRATNIAMCTLDEQGPEAFNSIHDALFANQPGEGGAGPENDELLAMAESAGVTVDEQCVQTEKFVPWVKEAREHAKDEFGVTGTPTIFVDGEEVQEASMDAIQKAVEDAS